MPISKKNRIIFIHIPKNAGESIEKSLGMYGGNPRETFWGVIDNRIVLQHLTAQQKKALLKNDKIWSDFYKFAVVRNPWSKAVSEYNWYLRYGPKCDFKFWVSTLPNRIAINNSINILEVGHNLPQNLFVFDENGKLMVDKILQFENIEEEFSSLMRQLNLEVNLMKAETTASAAGNVDFRDYYDAESIEMIEDVYRKDIELFSYSRRNTF